MCATCMSRILCSKLWIKCDNGILTRMHACLLNPSPSTSGSISLWISYFLKIAITVAVVLSLSFSRALFLCGQNMGKYLVLPEFLPLFTVSRHTHTHTLTLVTHSRWIFSVVCSFVRCRIARFASISSHIIYLLHLFCLCRENSWCVSFKVSAFGWKTGYK